MESLFKNKTPSCRSVAGELHFHVRCVVIPVMKSVHVTGISSISRECPHVVEASLREVRPVVEVVRLENVSEPWWDSTWRRLMCGQVWGVGVANPRCPQRGAHKPVPVLVPAPSTKKVEVG